ncbi:MULTISPECIES: Ppx/GppA phosphatase family protein [Arthrobacter]|uniref:Exopolyphosphatase n=1 Tax=Arthrobacter psychrochitiniphilus TaxID=291045 RepID=A0A2V3DWI4_9MICC|nr:MULTISPECIES: Ppx/GppA phosphatase family protein [Arthrobacter]NYG16470.1 exopolyphosphatase/guanosine-5'-triphosphate,3'-diphosphate pyrophosphatase [Arthrobacter psychrochitiniphilus]PXA69387.1 exopolyphosphatase [Arthrobacter psychrochitiniphilus]
MRVAAIDCGTNSIRLLIADVSLGAQGGASLSDVHREMRVVRLGQDVDVTGLLAPEALVRTFAAVDDYAAIIAANAVERVRFVATSATRDAGNRDEFVAGIKARLGLEPEVVSGDQEAALSFAGAVSVLPVLGESRVLVVDLGGGSTEFVVGDGKGVVAGVSTNMGCVRFTERYLKSDPPTEAEIAAAEAAIEDKLQEVLAAVPLANVTQVVGVAGSITTITAHALGLESYQSEVIHAAVVPLETVDAAATSLLSMTRAQRAELGFMHPGRVDVIGAGALIWRTVLRRVSELNGGRVESATTSEHDILDGIALGAARS